MNYFLNPNLSNSKLTHFGQEVGLLPKWSDVEPTEAYRLGTLFDFVATDSSKIDRLNKRLITTPYSFTNEELERSERMYKSLSNNTFYKQILLLKPIYQREIYNDNFTLDGKIYVPMKAKLDLFLIGVVIDLKTTIATSQRQFEALCAEFGYFRQMILYMRMCGVKRSTIIGISKRAPYNVFVVHFDESHPMYRENYDMLCLLIFKCKLLK